MREILDYLDKYLTINTTDHLVSISNSKRQFNYFVFKPAKCFVFKYVQSVSYLNTCKVFLYSLMAYLVNSMRYSLFMLKH
mgnify:CR=1 FL=1